MKTKLVLMGADAEDKKILIAMELVVAENQVKTWIFPEAIATPEFEDIMMKEWRVGKEVAFPEGFTLTEKELSVTDNLLPEDIKTDRTDLVMRAQTEWAFIVLSSKMSTMFHNELADLKEKVKSLDQYDSAVWNDLKGFWGKVQNQMKERNLFREHADQLKEGTNELFSEMKEMRTKMESEFKSVSKEASTGLMAAIQLVEEKLGSGNGRLAVLFEDLKNIQKDFKDTKLSREDRSAIWERLDKTFKAVKEKRFGKQEGDDSALGRTNNRLTGLLKAIDRMEKSIYRDRDDLDFQNKRIGRSDNQLEAQIRVAKIRMIEERIRSKEEKLKDMKSTQEQLEKKVTNIKVRTEKEEAMAKAKKEAEDKIASKIDASQDKIAPEDAEKLAKAAEKIKEGKAKKGGKKKAAAAGAATVLATAAAAASTDDNKAAPEAKEAAPEPAAAVEEDSTMEAVGTIVSEGIEDAVDTLKAIAAVVGGKIEQAVTTLQEDIKEAAKEVEEKVEKAKAAEEEE